MDGITYLQHTKFLELVKCIINSRLLPNQPTGSPLRVLEVGCGTGEFAHLLKHHYKDKIEMTGIDPSERAIQTAQNKPDITFINQPLLDWKADSQYELVFFTKSLHHCHSLEKTVQRAYDFLTEDGLLLVEELEPADINLATIKWFCDRADLLVAANLLNTCAHPSAILDHTLSPQERWNTLIQARSHCHSGIMIKDTILSIFGKDKMEIYPQPGLHYSLTILK
ncbi:S-adenosyl-L-methionine-dependent methyltransferase [Chlamydoabsidia padenii]|nr:S-adenosyl-L-methionine-dependent methyltransferase [Chlamydoabsidia padenii]